MLARCNCWSLFCCFCLATCFWRWDSYAVVVVRTYIKYRDVCECVGCTAREPVCVYSVLRVGLLAIDVNALEMQLGNIAWFVLMYSYTYLKHSLFKNVNTYVYLNFKKMSYKSPLYDGVYNKKCLLDTHTIKEMEPAVHLYIHTSVCGRKGLGFCALLQLASLSFFLAVCFFFLVCENFIEIFIYFFCIFFAKLYVIYAKGRLVFGE